MYCNLIRKRHGKFVERFSIDEYQFTRCVLCPSLLSRCCRNLMEGTTIMAVVSAMCSSVLGKKHQKYIDRQDVVFFLNIIFDLLFMG